MDQALASTVRRRGHQHHPRHVTRRRLDITTSRGPAQCGPAGSNTDHRHPADLKGLNNQLIDNKTQIITLDQSQTIQTPTGKLSSTELVNSAATDQLRPAQCGRSEQNNIQNDNRLENTSTNLNYTSENKKSTKLIEKRSSDNKQLINSNKTPTKSRKKIESPEPEHAVARARGDGHSDDENQNDEDPELAELAKLRCGSERTEVHAEREARRRKRCADYPGLAFGSSIFSSDTMMKFSLIKNELQNIMSNQLKRVSMWFMYICECFAGSARVVAMTLAVTTRANVKVQSSR